MKYDIFLGGPWEKHEAVKYKTMIKNAFPDKAIYDPEDASQQQTGDWFPINMQALENSLTMVCFVPFFPFPGVAPEAGYFYSLNHNSDYCPLESLATIWLDDIKPAYGRKVAEKLGPVFDDVQGAIDHLKNYLAKDKVL